MEQAFGFEREELEKAVGQRASHNWVKWDRCSPWRRCTSLSTKSMALHVKPT